MAVALTTPDRTLATLLPGETATIASFLFGAVRAACGDLGLREGDVVHCRAGTGGVLLLDTQQGGTISLARDWARFIQLVPVLPAQS